MINELVKAVQATGNIVLATHIRPDGDALGSLFGLADILADMGKRVICYLEEPVSDMYGFLPPAARIETDFGAIQTFVDQSGDDILGICLDCGDIGRLGKKGPELRKITPHVVIDHHQGNSGFGDIAWIEPHRSSTGEMIYDLAVELGVAEKLSQEAAECLYTAIVTDTGSFQYDSTSSHTFRVAAHLVDLGVQPASVCQKIYDNASFGGLQLMQLVLATLQTYIDDQVAVIQVSQKMLRTTGTTGEDCQGLINFPRSVGAVRVAVFLKEGNQEKEQYVTCSLRAKGDCDVAKVAAEFAGGGHRNAAGFRMNGHSMEQVRDMLLPLLEQALRQGVQKQ
jgi:phosphoesterase RecJ-like protein